MSEISVGVLALQGAFERHLSALQNIGIKGVAIRSFQELAGCDGLILPGGESTTMDQRLDREALVAFGKRHPIFGTCAGLILLARYGLLSIEVERNAYGRQKSSFIAPLQVTLDEMVELPGLFIRAPKITRILSPSIHVRSTHGEDPVLVEEGWHLGSTFHPELTPSVDIHRYFAKRCLARKSLRSKTSQ